MLLISGGARIAFAHQSKTLHFNTDWFVAVAYLARPINRRLAVSKYH